MLMQMPSDTIKIKRKIETIKGHVSKGETTQSWTVYKPLVLLKIHQNHI